MSVGAPPGSLVLVATERFSVLAQQTGRGTHSIASAHKPTLSALTHCKGCGKEFDPTNAWRHKKFQKHGTWPAHCFVCKAASRAAVPELLIHGPAASPAAPPPGAAPPASPSWPPLRVLARSQHAVVVDKPGAVACHHSPFDSRKHRKGAAEQSIRFQGPPLGRFKLTVPFTGLVLLQKGAPMARSRCSSARGSS
jgi:hypothetical protein